MTFENKLFSSKEILGYNYLKNSTLEELYDAHYKPELNQEYEDFCRMQLAKKSFVMIIYHSVQWCLESRGFTYTTQLAAIVHSMVDHWNSKKMCNPSGFEFPCFSLSDNVQRFLTRSRDHVMLTGLMEEYNLVNYKFFLFAR